MCTFVLEILEEILSLKFLLFFHLIKREQQQQTYTEKKTIYLNTIQY